MSGVPSDSDWILITKEPSIAIEVFVSPKTISRVSDDVVRGWVKYRYSTPKSFESKYIKELAVYNEYNCRERTSRILRSEAYFTDGTSEPDLSARKGHVLSNDEAFKYLCK